MKDEVGLLVLCARTWSRFRLLCPDSSDELLHKAVSSVVAISYMLLIFLCFRFAPVSNCCIFDFDSAKYAKHTSDIW